MKIDLDPVPEDVIAAVRTIEQWVESKGLFEQWELMSICSRDHASKLRQIYRAFGVSNPE